MAFQRGDIIKEVWKEHEETRYLLIIDKLEPLGLLKDRYKLYDLGCGETDTAGLFNSSKVEYTLHFRPPNGNSK